MYWKFQNKQSQRRDACQFSVCESAQRQWRPQHTENTQGVRPGPACPSPPQRFILRFRVSSCTVGSQGKCLSRGSNPACGGSLCRQFGVDPCRGFSVLLKHGQNVPRAAFKSKIHFVLTLAVLSTSGSTKLQLHEPDWWTRKHRLLFGVTTVTPQGRVFKLFISVAKRSKGRGLPSIGSLPVPPVARAG